MSDCRWGVRPYPVREYDRSLPIRGRLVYSDGTDSRFTFARYVNGRMREVRAVEIDGKRFAEVPDIDWDAEQPCD